MHPVEAVSATKFRAGWEFTITAVKVLQLRVEDRDEEGIKHLCCLCIHICNVTILIK